MRNPELIEISISARLRSRPTAAPILPALSLAGWRRPLGGIIGSRKRAQHDEYDRRHDGAGNDVHDHGRAPAHVGEQQPDEERRDRFTEIAAHAVQGEDQPLAVGIAVGERRNGGGMPQVVADADERHAGEQHPVVVGERIRAYGRPTQNSESAIRNPSCRRIDQHPARHVGQRAREGCTVMRSDFV